jgi:hypothetical protein
MPPAGMTVLELPANAPKIAPTEVLPPTPPPPAPALRRVAPTEVLPPTPQAAAPRLPAIERPSKETPPSRPRRSKREQVVRVQAPLNAPPDPSSRRSWVLPVLMAAGLCVLVIAGGLLILSPRHAIPAANSPGAAVQTDESSAAHVPPPRAPAPSPPVPVIPVASAPTQNAAAPDTVRAAAPRREKARVSHKRQGRYNADGVPLIMP